MTDLSTAIALVQDVLDEWNIAIDGYSPMGDFDAWRDVTKRAYDTAVARLTNGGALVRKSEHIASIKFAGVQSISTIALQLALRNWMGSARRRLAKGGQA